MKSPSFSSPEMRRAIVRMKVSPAAWPCTSLIDLKSSRSMAKTEKEASVRLARVSVSTNSSPK